MPNNSATAVAYRARWVFPIDGPPIPQGVVTIAAGRIVAVGARTDEANLVDLGNVALLPALINAHTHLEFSLFQQPFGQRGQSFSAWLKELVSWRREQPAVQGQEQLALAQGLQESEAAGTAVLGEITTPVFAEHWSRQTETLPHLEYFEVLSLNPERVPVLASLAEKFLEQHAASGRRGLSPHAPYTVHPELLVRAVRISAEKKIPLAMHLAESREELELLSTQTGQLVDLLKALTAWYPGALSPGLRPLDYLQSLSQAHRAIVAHGNYLSPTEIEFTAQQRAKLSVAYCPRTQAHFDHDPYPLAAMLQAGVRVAVGTDSRASNPDLSIWRELQFVQQHFPQIDPGDILRMGTMAGAEALGVAQDFGSVAIGKLAVFAVVELPSESNSPWDLFADPQAKAKLLRVPPMATSSSPDS